MGLGATSKHSERARLVHLGGPVIDQIPLAIALFDTDFRCVMVNQRWMAQLPCPTGDPVGLHCDEIFASDCPHLHHYLDRAFQGAGFTSDPESTVTSDGTVRWHRSHLSPWRDAEGNVGGAMVVCEDITGEIEQTLRNRVLSEQIEQFDDRAQDVAVFFLDVDGRITLWNDGAEHLTGWSELEVLGQTTNFLFGDEGRAANLPRQQIAMARKHDEFRDRNWCVRKDGTRFRADMTISRIEGEDLLPDGFGQVLREVRSEDSEIRSLEANAVLLGSILKAIPDALVVIDVEGRIRMFSKAAQAMFGYTASEVLGLNVSILMPERERAAHYVHLAHNRLMGRIKAPGRKRRLIGLRKDGTEFPHSLQLVETQGGDRRMIAGFIHDLSAEEATSAQLEQVQRELAHIARLHEMGTLATTIAHELNQPLMSVVNIVQTAADIMSKGDPPSKKALAKALSEAGREAIRAGDILRRLRVFLSHGDLEKTLADPCKLAEDAIYFEAASARYRKITCKVECAPELPTILVDRVQIQQVILNLVKNAIQSVGANGTVTVAITAEPDNLRFTVTDTGPGVPPDRIARLFEPFSTTKTDGMGLGLPICKSIIEAHGGAICYQPSSAGGATFVFTLPKTIEEIEDA